MTASIYETLSYYPAGTHIVVEAPGLAPMIVETGLDLRVNGRAVPARAESASTVSMVRAALCWADDATDWSEGSEAWDEVGYETRRDCGPTPGTSEMVRVTIGVCSPSLVDAAEALRLIGLADPTEHVRVRDERGRELDVTADLDDECLVLRRGGQILAIGERESEDVIDRWIAD